ncbi:MAG TPA: hypothetical protein VGE37_08580 [Archangium sp.]
MPSKSKDSFEAFAAEVATVFKKQLAALKSEEPLEWVSLVSERGQEEKLSLSWAWGTESEGEKLKVKSEFFYVADEAPDDDDLDSDEFEEACDAVRKFGALVALGLVALELKKNPKLIRAPLSKKFKIYVADDTEMPDVSATLDSPDWDVTDTDLRAAVLDAIFGQSKTRAMFEALLKKSGKDADLLGTLAKL